MLELYGLTRENFPGGVEAWERGLHPDDSSRAIEECQAALRGERDFDTEFRVLKPDGVVVHIKANGLVLRDQEGKPLRMIGLNTDITERKLAEEKIRELNEHLEQKINERTAELKKNILLLEETNKAFVGRELKMIELKKRIAGLENKAS